MKDLAGSISSESAHRRKAAGPKGEGRYSPSTFPAYPEYKDSGVEWLGNVPAHWDVAPVASWFELRNGYPFKAELFSPEGKPEDRLIRIRDILKEESRIFTAESCPSWAEVNNGDVLIGMDGDFNVAYWSKGPAKLNQRVCALRGKSIAWDSFIFYGIPQPLKIINDLTFSTTVKHLSSNQVLKMRFPLPSESEVSNIVAFLDHETARIDALVEEQQRLIALLKEKRQAVISHAVTKGLDPDVPMKDSGVEWLGEVPAHWDTPRLKHIADAQGGGTPSKEREDYWMGDIPWVSPKDMKRDVITKTIDNISEEAVVDSGLRAIPFRSILVVVRGMILAHTFPVAISGTEVTINQDMKAITPDCEKLLPEYLLLLLRGIDNVIFDCIDSSAHGTKKLQWEEFFNTQVPVPSIDEQLRISSEVQAELDKIEQLTSQAQLMARTLSERRSALISAAVTGKIDVRGWIPQADSAPAQQNTRMEAV